MLCNLTLITNKQQDQLLLESDRKENSLQVKTCRLLSIVGIPGLEPGKAGPESAVLPLHHIPMLWEKFLPLMQVISHLQVQSYSVFFELASKNSTFFLKKMKNEYLCYILSAYGFIMSTLIRTFAYTIFI